MTMSDTEDTRVTSAPRTIRLRRLIPQRVPVNSISTSPPKVSEDVIQQNLVPLKINVEKKQRAQEMYYERTGLSNSPMTRTQKRPVKQRLGVNQRVQFYGTSTTLLPPKIRLRRVGMQRTLNNLITNRKTRFNVAQQRLDHIRAKNLMLPTSQPKRIRLRRLGSDTNYATTSLRVSVPNNAYSQRYPIRRFRQILNHHIQEEIRKVQQQSPSTKLILPVEFHPVTTSLKMSDRFGALI